MEVVLDFFNGDLDKMFVIGVLYNGLNKLVIFSYVGGLLGNCFLLGMKIKEIQVNCYNQLCFDDMFGQISSQLVSEYVVSELNLGYLIQLCMDGNGQVCGEGVELCIDVVVLLCVVQGILLIIYVCNKVVGQMLDCDEFNELFG